MTTASNAPSTALKAFVALTPLLGSLLVPLLVPLLMARVSIAAGVLALVIVGTGWFVAMLRTSEMPPHPEEH
ncbi:MAG: hypothetical protein VKO39_11545 [Cyanobacteriota bacterium]|nr:hypothetical protein [Cyanobacteriota bacterium]